MKSKNRIYTILAVMVLLAVILLVCAKFYHREQSFLEILPEIQEFETETVQIMRNDAESSVPMSEELFDEFINDMDKFTYQHVTDAFGMDSFGRMIYFSQGTRVELLFSNERGGSILVNPVDNDDKEPIYKVVGSNYELEKIFDTYVGKATGQLSEESE